MDEDDDRARGIKRVRRACLNCRRKKVRCHGEQPQCSLCVRLGQDCHYPSTFRSIHIEADDSRYAIPTSDTYMTLLSRVASLEDQLKTIHNGSRLVLLDNADTPDTTTTRVVQSSVERFRALPPANIVAHAIDLFFVHSHNQPYSLFHEKSFRKCHADGLLPDFLVLSLLATSVRFSTDPYYDGQQELAADTYATSAWRLVAPQCFDDELVSRRLVQATTLLSIYDFVGCRNQAAWIKIGLACRMAQLLNMMFEPDPLLPFSLQEEHRRSYWSIYLLDKLVTCSRGRPATIQDYSCQLQLPCTEEGFRNSRWQRTPTLQEINNHDVAEQAINSLGSFGRIIVLAAELHRITVYVMQKYDQGNDKPPWDPASQFSLIRARLMWLDTQFEISRSISDAIYEHNRVGPGAGTTDLASDEALIFSCALYDLCHCLLQHPFMLRCLLERNDIKFRTTFFSQAVEASWRHAQSLTSTLQMAREEGNLAQASFLAYCSSIAGSIDALHMYSESEAIRQVACLSFRQNVAFVRNHARIWKNSHQIAEALVCFGESALRYRAVTDLSSPRLPLTQSDMLHLYELLDYCTMSNNNRLQVQSLQLSSCERDQDADLSSTSRNVSDTETSLTETPQLDSTAAFSNQGLGGPYLVEFSHLWDAYSWDTAGLENCVNGDELVSRN